MPLYPFLCLHPVEEYFRTNRAIKASPQHMNSQVFQGVITESCQNLHIEMPVASLFVNHFVPLAQGQYFF